MLQAGQRTNFFAEWLDVALPFLTVSAIAGSVIREKDEKYGEDSSLLFHSMVNREHLSTGLA